FELTTSRPQRPYEVQDRPFVAPGERLPIEHACEQMERHGKGRALDPGEVTRPVDHRRGKARLLEQVSLRANLAQEVPGLRVAPEKHMLAVIHQLTGGRILKGRRPSAQSAARLEDQHARAVPRQSDCGTQSREPGPDDDGILSRHAGNNHSLNAISACFGFDPRTRAENTSYPLRSIRISVSK